MNPSGATPPGGVGDGEEEEAEIVVEEPLSLTRRAAEPRKVLSVSGNPLGNIRIYEQI